MLRQRYKIADKIINCVKHCAFCADVQPLNEIIIFFLASNVNFAKKETISTSLKIIYSNTIDKNYSGRVVSSPFLLFREIKYWHEISVPVASLP